MKKLKIFRRDSKGKDGSYDWTKADEQLVAAVENDDLEQLNELLRSKKAGVATKIDPQGHTAIHRVALRGRTPLLEALLEHNSDTSARDAQGRVPLHDACRRDHVELARLLLQHNKQCINAFDNYQLSPLHHSCIGKSKDCAKLLLRSKAPVDPIDKEGRTPLFYAAKLGQVEICKLLVNEGSNFNWQDNKKKTALIVAAENNQVNVCDYLVVTGGADAHVKDVDGHNAKWYAEINDNQDIINILMRRGAPNRHSSNISNDYATIKVNGENTGSLKSEATEEVGIVPLNEFQDLDLSDEVDNVSPTKAPQEKVVYSTAQKSEKPATKYVTSEQGSPEEVAPPKVDSIRVEPSRVAKLERPSSGPTLVAPSSSAPVQSKPPWSSSEEDLAQLANFQELQQAHDDEVSILKRQIEQLSDENKSLKSSMKQQDSGLDPLKLKIAMLERELERSEKEGEKSRREIEEARRLEQEEDEKELRKAETMIEKLEGENKRLKMHMLALGNETSDAFNENENYQKKIRELEKAVGELRADNDDLLTEIDSCKRQNSALKSDSRDLEDIIGLLQNEKAELIQKAEEKKDIETNNAKGMDEERSKLQERIDQLQDRNAQLALHVGRLEDQAKISENQAKQHEKEKNDLVKDLQELNRKLILQAEDKKASECNDTKGMDEERNELVERIDQLQEQNEKLALQLNDQAKLNENQTKQYDKEKNELVKDFQERNRKLTSQIALLKTKEYDADRECDKMVEKAADKEKENAQLRELLLTANRQLDDIRNSNEQEKDPQRAKEERELIVEHLEKIKASNDDVRDSKQKDGAPKPEYIDEYNDKLQDELEKTQSLAKVLNDEVDSLKRETEVLRKDNKKLAAQSADNGRKWMADKALNDELEALRRQIEELLQDNEELATQSAEDKRKGKAEKKKMEEENEGLQTEIDNLKHEKAKAQRKVDEQEENCQGLRDLLKLLEEENDGLKRELSLQDLEDMSKLSEREKELADKLERSRSNNKAMEDELNRANEVNRELDNKIGELKKRLNDERRESDEKSLEALEKLKQEKKKLRKDLDDKCKELENLNTSWRISEQRLEETIGALEEENDGHKEHIAELSEQIQVLRDNQQHSEFEKDNTIERLQGITERLEEENSILRLDLLSLARKEDQLTPALSLKRSQSMSADYTNQIRDNIVKLKLCSVEERRRIARENESLRDEMEQLTRMLEKKAKEQQHQQDDHNRRESMESLKHTPILNAAARNQAELEDEIDDLNAEIARLDKIKRELLIEVKDLKEKVEGEKSNGKKKDDQIEALNKKNERLVHEMKDLKDRAQESGKFSDEAKAIEAEEYRKKCEELGRENDELRRLALLAYTGEQDGLLMNGYGETAATATISRERQTDNIVKSTEHSVLALFRQNGTNYVHEKDLQKRLKMLQNEAEEKDANYRGVVSVYRSHLLAAVQGKLNPEVKRALQLIVARQQQWPDISNSASSDHLSSTLARIAQANPCYL